MSLNWKKILEPLLTVVIVGVVMFFSLRPDQIIGILVMALTLAAFWGTVEFLYRRKRRQH
jgi:hypothetical protein